MVKNLFQKNPLQDLLSSLNAVILTNERNWILTGHVIFKLRYNQIYQLKTTNKPWSKTWFNILLHTQSIVCATVDSQRLEYLGYITLT